ncbi:MAG: hypothetical protein ABIY70_06375 [Capsulimonas sp.]|uniref:hypothetical protein n=1 Tax=Capsulimonas sp. TaxID=2494211 RepID=UPI0032636A2A
MKWEVVDKPKVELGGAGIFKLEFEARLARAKVPGGWLILTVTAGAPAPHSITFYPDPTHAWDPNRDE